MKKEKSVTKKNREAYKTLINTFGLYCVVYDLNLFTLETLLKM